MVYNIYMSISSGLDESHKVAGLRSHFNRRFKQSGVRKIIIEMIALGISLSQISRCVPGVSEKSLREWLDEGERLLYLDGGEKRDMRALDVSQQCLVSFVKKALEARREYTLMVAKAELEAIKGGKLESLRRGMVRFVQDEDENKETAAQSPSWSW